MNRHVANAKVEAEHRFLGKDPVVGVAVSGDQGQQLTFFLHHHASEIETAISRWAERFGINFEFRVVGRFKPLL